jgi:hypothetical protein
MGDPQSWCCGPAGWNGHKGARNEGKADWIFSAQAHAKRLGRAKSITHHHSMPDSFWFMKRNHLCIPVHV